MSNVFSWPSHTHISLHLKKLIEIATPYSTIHQFPNMIEPAEIPVAECFKRTANNDTDTKANNTGTYEHALSLTVSCFP
jgi:hypothetical protein